MAQLRDIYGQEVIDSLVKSYSADTVVEETEATEDTIDPLTQIVIREFIKLDGQSLFSELFWKPKTIPDIPITVFKREDWAPEAQLHIPALDPNWVWNREALESFALAMHEGDTTLLHGLQGTGKSCFAEQWCAVTVTPFWRMSCNRETREQHFLGGPVVDYNESGQMFIKQEPTLLTGSLKHGGMFCEDEAFRHNSALVLQSLREKNNRSLIVPDNHSVTKLTAPKGRWWYVLTDNTCGSGDETGVFDAEVQDASTLDRIDTTIEVKYLGKPEERAMLQKYCGLNDDIINGMLDVAKMVRTAFTKQTLMHTISVRGLMSWANKIELMGSIGKGLQYSWYNKLGTTDQKVVEDIFHQVFARKITD